MKDRSEKNNLFKYESILPEGDEIPLNTEHFETPTQQSFNLIFVVMNLPWNCDHFLLLLTTYLFMYLTLHS